MISAVAVCDDKLPSWEWHRCRCYFFAIHLQLWHDFFLSGNIIGEIREPEQADIRKNGIRRI
jgi:hypothetical protein